MHNKELDVVEALLRAPASWHYSLQLGTVAGIAAGTIYPMLARLEKAGWLESRWDVASPGARRRLYRLTGLGQRCAQDALKERKSPTARRPRRFGFGLSRPQEVLV